MDVQIARRSVSPSVMEALAFTGRVRVLKESQRLRALEGVRSFATAL
jgi:hypothetical protein